MQVADRNREARTTVVLAVACLVLQLALAPNLALGNGRANFALVFAACVALTKGGQRAVISGFVAGLVFDLSTTGPVGLMAVAGAALRGASRLFAVGSRPVCVEAAKAYGATDIINYREGDIVQQILDQTHGKGVDRVILAGGDNDTFRQAVEMVKPGGCIGNVNYLGSGDYVRIPRVEWGCGMGHKTIRGGLMPGGRLRMEKLASLMETGRLDTSRLLTHRFQGFAHMEEALLLMKDKPRDLIKPVVIL